MELRYSGYLESFELYEIFALPVFSKAGNIGLRYAQIPAFLVVGKNHQTFMELTEYEVRVSQGRSGSVCPPSTAIYRQNFMKTCAMAPFLQDPEKVKRNMTKL